MPLYISPKLLKYFKGFCSSPEIIMLFVYMIPITEFNLANNSCNK
ncbi:MAG: hypothetical protein QMO91_06435 [Candidatus Tisiphia sp.]|nr:hypothetical protein [Candidatus Tisiphia sp.]